MQQLSQVYSQNQVTCKLNGVHVTPHTHSSSGQENGL